VSDFSPSFKIQNSVSFGEEQKRIPDLRSLLHWQSNLIIDTENPGTVSFYTGDIKGEFVISLVGLTNTGEFIQLEKTINVISD
ncbi:MAG TPA: hypothetical protein VLA03_06750, partial [Draconibacterium sp.]|nr:hypothetical protein [Draconibacterium sp.]